MSGTTHGSLTKPGAINAYISEIHVLFTQRKDMDGKTDPQHAMATDVTLIWVGPDASRQKKGPLYASPGAGLEGFNCNDIKTSNIPDSKCTPKGSFKVQGFAPHLYTHPKATFVTWFVIARHIAFHYFDPAPDYAASNGCIRLRHEKEAKLIHDHSVVNLTTVHVSGTWVMPHDQYSK